MPNEINADQGPVSKHLVGKVTPPDDMMEAARNSLDATAFENLMLETQGKPPTPEQLCKKVDEVRLARQ